LLDLGQCWELLGRVPHLVSVFGKSTGGSKFLAKSCIVFFLNYPCTPPLSTHHITSSRVFNLENTWEAVKLGHDGYLRGSWAPP